MAEGDGYDWSDFDRRFGDLLRKFNHRAQREADLQIKLKDIMDSISFMLKEPAVVQEEL